MGNVKLTIKRKLFWTCYPYLNRKKVHSTQLVFPNNRLKRDPLFKMSKAFFTCRWYGPISSHKKLERLESRAPICESPCPFSSKVMRRGRGRRFRGGGHYGLMSNQNAPTYLYEINHYVVRKVCQMFRCMHLKNNLTNQCRHTWWLITTPNILSIIW